MVPIGQIGLEIQALIEKLSENFSIETKRIQKEKMNWPNWNNREYLISAALLLSLEASKINPTGAASSTEYISDIYLGPIHFFKVVTTFPPLKNIFDIKWTLKPPKITLCQFCICVQQIIYLKQIKLSCRVCSVIQLLEEGDVQYTEFLCCFASSGTCVCIFQTSNPNR